MAASRESIIRSKAIREAEGYLSLDMPEHALRALERITPQADDWLWLLCRGEALRDLDRFDEAVPLFEAVLRLQPDHAGARLALGWCHKRLGQIDLACADLETALSLHPDHLLVIYNLACYYSLAGKVESALECLRRALELQPDFRYLIRKESDFDPIRDDPRFQELVNP